MAIPDPAARAMARLVALDGVMPVHASVTEAIAADGLARRGDREYPAVAG